jgi:hypothetical protein
MKYEGEATMPRFLSAGLFGVLMFVVVSGVGAQQTPQPVIRTGNFFEVGNDLFMHIIATADIRYRTADNLDFESNVRDRATSRNPSSTAQHDTEGDLTYAELRLGVDFRYQKNLTFHLLFENQSVFDGNLIDDRSNTSNPGGTDIFGRGASTENPGFRVERYYIRYKFPGTPVRLHIGADLQSWSLTGIQGTDDPRIGIDIELGDLRLYASANVGFESQRLGLQNDNDFIYYIFGGTYDLKPHRFGFDVVYYRDRFNGADTQSPINRDIGFLGQKVDSVWLNAAWMGRFGPVLGMLQGNLSLGTARGGVAGIPAGIAKGRDLDIFSGGVIAYAEVDFKVARPFVGFIYGSGDGDPSDNKLHGFTPDAINNSTQIHATSFMGHLDRSVGAGGGRDFSCPGRLRGVRRGAPANNPSAIGADVLADGAGGAVAECYHTVSNVWNVRVGNDSHPGISTPYSNPGTLSIPVGVRVFPVKGHEITGWYSYRAMADSTLVERAFIRGTDPGFTGSINKTLYHELGAFWMWTLNPYFDFRLTGNIGINGEGGKDIARLANCTRETQPGFRSCQGDDVALKGEARFRARF